jgi:hypothetical protein
MLDLLYLNNKTTVFFVFVIASHVSQYRSQLMVYINPVRLVGCYDPSCFFVFNLNYFLRPVPDFERTSGTISSAVLSAREGVADLRTILRINNRWYRRSGMVQRVSHLFSGIPR